MLKKGFGSLPRTSKYILHKKSGLNIHTYTTHMIIQNIIVYVYVLICIYVPQ